MDLKVEDNFSFTPPQNGEEIIITGVAGKFPESENVYELRDNLFNKVDMVTEDDRRWSIKHPEIPSRAGKVPNIDKFDAGSFGIHHRQASSMDPMLRMTLEKVIEAIIDAGYHPSELEGTKTGVFVASSASEAEQMWIREKREEQHFPITGLTKSMIAHRVSYFLKLSGMSHNLDSACSSTLYALDCAYRALRNGHINAGIVIGVHLCLSPFHTKQLNQLGALSKRGRCNAFDIAADGYVRSEAVGVLFIQKLKDSRRVYAKVMHCKANCDGFKQEGITFPSDQQQETLFKEVLEESQIDPEDLTYLEAHGTGTAVGDPIEVKSIDTVYAKNLKTPLLIGSVKSNVGHGETSSGIISIVKVIIAMETGAIPPNINFTAIRPGIEALEKGRIRVVTETTPLPNNNGLFGVNNYGMGGANAHAILKWNTKGKINEELPKDNLPRLICVSSRTKEGINSLLGTLANNKLDQEYIRLYHQVFSKNFDNHYYRAYTILTKNEELERCISYHRGTKRALSFLFGSFSNKWCKIYKDLKELPIFSESLQRVDDILATKKLNMRNLFENYEAKSSNSSFDQIIGNLVIQIAFADMLKALEVRPQSTLGIGLGEFICGYFENCLTLEETIACVYEIASNICSINDDRGTYFVGLIGNVLEQVPAELKITHIYPKGVTVTGNAEILTKFIVSLKSKNVFVQKIENDDVSFQNDAFNRMKPKLTSNLSEILTKPKSRPTRWLSNVNHSLFPAEFFLESISSVFDWSKLAKNLDKHSTIFEIGIGQPIELDDNLTRISFRNISSSNGVILLLENLGRLYNLGCNMDVAQIYPKVEYPVSRSTPIISPFIKWDHSKSWFVPKYEEQIQKQMSSEHIYKIDLNDDNFSYITGHVVNGRNLYPATGYLCLVWDTVTSKMGSLMKNSKIIFKNCRFLRATNLSRDKPLEMTVLLDNFCYFKVMEGDEVALSGQVFITDKIEDYQTNIPLIYEQKEVETSPKLITKDVYKELRLRGYNYSGEFRSITECSIDASFGKIQWNQNWITFMDNMLQMRILQLDTRGFYVPVTIQQLSIDAPGHLACTQMFGEKTDIPVYVNKDSGLIKCGGIEIRGLKASRIARRRPLEEPVLETHQFVPFEACLNVEDAVRVNIQLALENTPVLKVKVVELIDEETNNDDIQPLAPIIFDTLVDLPLVHSDVSVFTKKHLDLMNVKVEDRNIAAETECYLIVGSNLSKRPLVLKQAIASLISNGYLLSREALDFNPSQFEHPQMSIMTIYENEVEKLLLYRKFMPSLKVPFAVNVDDLETFSWLPKLQELLKNNKDVVIYSQNQSANGILGLINCIRKEDVARNTRAMLINDAQAPEFNLNHQFYKEQLKKQLAVNVYQDGKWGSYRHLKMDESKEIECENCIANTTVKGDLSSLRWIQGPLKFNSKLGFEEELVHVYYSSLNFKDVMIASGRIHAEKVARYQEEFSLGLEFVGRDSTGTRVMGMGSQGALSNLYAADRHLLLPIPNHWTMEDAATVPVVYGTVIFALFIRSSIKPGDSILIHCGSGGIGQAAMTLCLHYGCKVFTTVGTQEKREFLMKQFPELTDNVIGNSRDTSFEQMIYRETNGRGVDFVLNSLAEEKLLASVRCLAHGGQFLEIGKFDIQSNNPLNLLLMEKEATFNGTMLEYIFLSSSVEKNRLICLIEEGIANGSVQPLTRTVFDKDELEQAYRFITSGKHMGKVLIKIREAEQEKIIAPTLTTMNGAPRYQCDPEKTVIILGGLGGFGLELADWLVLRGARKLVLTSRKGVTSGYQESRIRIWRSYGVQVLISTADITKKSGCEELIIEATRLGPIQSIFNLAIVLQNALLEDQSQNTFKNSFVPKAYVTHYLDEITRRECPHLRDFVVFSSVACGRGNGGQANYAMANSVMERICEKRKKDGYSGLAIQWGAVGDVGIVAEMQNDHTALEVAGTLQQPIASCLEILDTLLLQNYPIVSSNVVATKKSVGNSVVETVATIMGIKDMKTFSLHSTLPELGMDSMSSVEIKQALERQFQIILSPREIRNMTITKLYEIQAETSHDADDNETKIVNNNSTNGFDMLISQIIDEIITKTEVVELNTKLEQHDQHSTQIILFPGIEGIAKTLSPLSRNLHSRAICVQYAMENQKDTIQEMATDVLPHILRIVQKSQPFYFVAYSFGSSVALEIVKVLEEEGYSGHLICVDGGPEFLLNLPVLLAGSEDNENTFQTNFLCYIMSWYMKQKVIQIHKESIAKCKSLDERLDIFEKIVPKDSQYQAKHLCKLAECLYRRTTAIRRYQPEMRIKATKVSLFKPEILSIKRLSDDYGLSNYCDQPVDVKIFSGDHNTILEDINIAYAINLWAGTVKC